MSLIHAYRWVSGGLVQIEHVDPVKRSDLVSIDRQIDLTEKNIKAFVSGKPALNMLLWGERGLGKSTIVKLMLHEYAQKGLTAVEFRNEDVLSIYDLYAEIRKMDKRYVMIYLDDISFDANDILYRMFKSVLEGGLEEVPKNCIFVATSNKRHMITEKAADTGDLYDRDDENEKTSLFARFGLTIGFYPIIKKDYLKIVENYLNIFEIPLYEGWERDAEVYAMDRGGRSGRIAKQFAIYKNIHENE
jgi:predicted AAA+ superfamily ATPase